MLPDSTKRCLLAWPPKGDPQIVWKRELGEGYAAIVTNENVLFVPYRKNDREHVAAINLHDGKLSWDRSWPVKLFQDMDRSFGSGPNATPLFADSRLIVASTDGKLRCLAANDGQPIWERDLHRSFGRAKRKEEYGYSGNLLRWKDWVLVPVGGESTRVAAFRIRDGHVAWKSGTGAVSYAPGVLTSLQGQTQYVYFTPSEVVSLDPDTGVELWTHPCTCFTGNNLTPAIRCDDEHVWVAGQLDAGTRLIRLIRQDGKTTTRQVWEDKRLTQAHWHSIVIGDVLFGCEGGNYESRFVAIDWRTGKTLWQERGHALAKPVQIGPARLAWVSDSGRFTMAHISDDGLQVLGEFPLLNAKAWTPITVVGNRVFARDQKSIVAFELPPGDE